MYRVYTIKYLPAWVVVCSLFLVMGCGSNMRQQSDALGTRHSAAASLPVVTTRGFKGDEDDDDVESDTGGSRTTADGDNDTDNDRADNAKKGYHDKDDWEALGYGHGASTIDAQTLSEIAMRYHKAAAGGSGPRTCGMLSAGVAGAVPDEYGRTPGPIYLRGARTCPAVMSRLLKHEHTVLAVPVAVTGVRVEGQEALVTIGSRQAPASYFLMKREGGAWKVQDLLPVPLP